MVQKVDIVLENFRPGVMQRLGLDYEALSGQNPGLVYASISGFGQSGPYAQRPAFDMIAQGMGGVVSITGEPGRDPVRVGYSIGDMGSSLFAVSAILAALHEKTISGKGQWVDVSMLDSQVALCENACARHFATGEVPQPQGSRHPLFTPFQAFATKDSHIVLIADGDQEWQKFCEAADRPQWLEDDRFASLGGRLKNYDYYLAEMNDLMLTRTTTEWLDVFEAHGIMCGPVNNIEQVLNDPHVQHREMVVEVAHERAGPLKVVGTPMKFSRTACDIKQASPDLGQHSESVLGDWLGYSKEQIEKLRRDKII
jgi:CoA:oxalate CoA-transferase